MKNDKGTGKIRKLSMLLGLLVHLSIQVSTAAYKLNTAHAECSECMCLLKILVCLR